MSTETLNKLYLELSRLLPDTKTSKEIELERLILLADRLAYEIDTLIELSENLNGSLFDTESAISALSRYRDMRAKHD